MKVSLSLYYILHLRVDLVNTSIRSGTAMHKKPTSDPTKQSDELLERLLTDQHLGAIVRKKSNIKRRFRCRRIA
jgi:hypothetical protein